MPESITIKLHAMKELDESRWSLERGEYQKCLEHLDGAKDWIREIIKFESKSKEKLS